MRIEDKEKPAYLLGYAYGRLSSCRRMLFIWVTSVNETEKTAKRFASDVASTLQDFFLTYYK
jgi:hypothetical protein